MFEKCLKFLYIYISKYLIFFNRWIFVGEVSYFYVKERKKGKKKSILLRDFLILVSHITRLLIPYMEYFYVMKENYRKRFFVK